MKRKFRYAETLEKKVERHTPYISIFNKPLIPEIPYPETISEAEIQAKIWRRLLNHGLDVKLEVVCPSDKIGKLGTRITDVRFDIVIFYEQKAFCVVEVKAHKKRKDRNISYFNRTENSKQAKKYAKYGITVFYCVGDEMVDRTVDRVRNLAKDMFSTMV